MSLVHRRLARLFPCNSYRVRQVDVHLVVSLRGLRQLLPNLCFSLSVLLVAIIFAHTLKVVPEDLLYMFARGLPIGGPFILILKNHLKIAALFDSLWIMVWSVLATEIRAF